MTQDQSSTADNDTRDARLQPLQACVDFLRSEEVALIKQAYADAFSGILTALGVRSGSTGQPPQEPESDATPSFSSVAGESTAPDVTDAELVSKPCVSAPVRTTMHDGAELNYQFWKPYSGSGIYVAWNYGDGDAGEYATLAREQSEDTAYINFQNPPTDLHRALVPDDTQLDDDFFSVIHGATEYSAIAQPSSDTTDNCTATHNSNPDFDAESIDFVPASAAHVGELTTGTVSIHTQRLSFAVQPWCRENSGAVYFAWRFGDQTGYYGTLNANVIWLGEIGAEYSNRRVDAIVFQDDATEMLRSHEHAIQSSSINSQ